MIFYATGCVEKVGVAAFNAGLFLLSLSSGIHQIVLKALLFHVPIEHQHSPLLNIMALDRVK